MRKLIFLLLFTTHFAFAQAPSIEQLQQNLQKVNLSIEESKSKIKTIRDAQFLPDLYFALAEFYVQKAKFMYGIKIAKSPGTPKEELDFAPEKRVKQLAIETYETFLDKFPDHSLVDRVLFLKAHEHKELGQFEEMIQAYEQLVKSFPKSKFADESRLIMADHYFLTEKKIPLALKKYKELSRSKSPEIRLLANFKMAKCYMELEKYSRSVVHYEKVLGSPTPAPEKNKTLKTDALIALVRPYSELGKLQFGKLPGSKGFKATRLKPLKYFKTLSPDFLSYQKVLKRLAKRMIIKKRYLSSTQIHFELLRFTPDIKQRMKITKELYVSLKNTQKNWPLKGFMIEVERSSWLVKSSQTMSKKEKRVHLKNLEIYARDIATRQDKIARKSLTAYEWNQTIDNYETYLRIFRKSKKRQSLELNLAEAYYSNENFHKAGLLYERLARKRKSDKALWDSTIESYMNTIRRQSELSQLAQLQARSGLRASSVRYLRKYPKSPFAGDLRFTVAQSYYDERDFKRATRDLKKFVQRYPNHKKVKVAVNLILDSYNQTENYKELVKYGKQVIDNKKIKSSSLKRQVANIVEQSELRMVQAQAGESGSANYAENLLQLARKYKGTKLGEKALYEAFTDMKSKRDPQSYRYGEQLLLKYKRSKYAENVLNEMIKMALVTADFKRASLYLELLSQRVGPAKQKQDALRSAAEMREAMGSFKLAARNYNRLGERDSVARVTFAAQDWLSLKRAAKRVQGPKRYYWQGIAEYNLNGIGPAIKYLRRYVKTEKSRGLESVAHSLFLLAENDQSLFKRIRMKAGQEAQAVQQKVQLLNRLNERLNSVIKSGEPIWTIASLYSLGLANKEFANFITSSPLPKGLSAGQKQQYQQALKQQAAQYSKAAKQFFSSCLKTAEKNQIFSDYTKGCRSRGKLTIDPENSTERNLSLRKTGKTVRALQKKLIDNARNIKLLERLTAAYIKTKNYSLAELTLRRGLEIKPDNSRILAKLGVVKIYQNDILSAREQFKLSLANGSSPLAAKGMAGLYKAYGLKKLPRKVRSLKAKPVKVDPAFIHPLMKGV